MAIENRQDERYTWPGGLGAISKKLSELLHSEFADRMHNGATTIAVVPARNGVQVTYMQGNELKSVAAKAVIMATPKFITRRIIEGLPEKQSEAMRQMRYIPYPVVNLIFDKPVFKQGYDTWCPGNSFTDFIVADWVVQKQPGYQQKANILTCYTPLREAERGYLLTESSAREVAVKVLSDSGIGCRTPGGTHLPARTSYVHVHSRPIHRGAAAGTTSYGSRLLCQHRF